MLAVELGYLGAFLFFGPRTTWCQGAYFCAACYSNMHLDKFVRLTCLPCSWHSLSCLSPWNRTVAISPWISFVQCSATSVRCEVFLLTVLQKLKNNLNKCRFWKTKSPAVFAFYHATLLNFSSGSSRKNAFKEILTEKNRSLSRRLCLVLIFLSCLYKYVDISLIVVRMCLYILQSRPSSIRYI